MNGAKICHEVEGCPGLYVDAFRGEYLRRTTNPDNVFILSHYHGDHYQALPRDFKYNGPALIHCTPVTANLLIHVHHVPSMYVVEHEYGSTWTYRIPPNRTMTTTSTKKKGQDDSALDGSHHQQHQYCPQHHHQARITFYDANHCPGACIILIQLTKREDETVVKGWSPPTLTLPDSKGMTETIMGTTMTTTTTTHVHTGDMRYDAKKFHSYPLLREAVERNEIDLVYLDTTYSHPKHDFCPQEEAVEVIAQQTVQLLLSSPALAGKTTSSLPSSSSSSLSAHEAGDSNNTSSQLQPDNVDRRPLTLVLLSCYSIGKEKVLWEASKRTNQLVYVTEKKYRMLQCIQPRKKNTRKSENKDNNNDDEKDDDDSSSSASSQIIERCTRDPYASDLHVIPMGLAGELWPFFRPNYQKCAQYVHDLEVGAAFSMDEEEKDGIIDDETGKRQPSHQQPVVVVPRGPPMTTTTTMSSSSTQVKAKKYDRVVAFIPTGWANGSNWNKRNATCTKNVTLPSGRTIQVEIRLISYSEHSAYQELVSFVEYLKPRKVIPTVFGDDADYLKIQRRFCTLLDSTRAKQAFFRSMMVKPATLTPPSISSSSSLSRTDRMVPGGDNNGVHTDQVAPMEVPSCEDRTMENLEINTKLETMVSMGFDRRRAKFCLEESGGNMENAVDKLLSSNFPTTVEVRSDSGDSMSTSNRQGRVVVDICNVAGNKTPTALDKMTTPQGTKRNREKSVPSSSGQITNFFPRKKTGS